MEWNLDNKPKRILVIGGSAAGPSAAAKAKRVDPEAEVSLFEAGDFISMGTCELPYLLAGELNDYKDLVFFSPESFYQNKGVKVYINHFVESLDTRRKRIKVNDLTDGETKYFDYDKVILTTGSIPKKLPFYDPELRNLFTLKNVGDYLKIKDYLDNNKVDSVAIFGAGYIGLETAEAFSKLGKTTYVIEKEPLPMPSAEIEVQHLIKDILDKHNVEFIGGAEKLRVNNIDKKIKNINIDNRLIEVDLVISAAGFAPNNYLATSAGLTIGNYEGIRVDSKMKTSDQHVFAAGDNTEIVNKVSGRYDYIPLATIAHEHGHIAGANAAGENHSSNPVVKNIAVKIFNKAFSSIGLSSKEAEELGYQFSSENAVVPNLVSIMPNSAKVFGKVIYEKNSRRILGAQFLGNNEVTGYADLLSTLIRTKTLAEILDEIDYNYTPPFSPFVNLLSVLGRKIKKEIK
jgi:NADPH-dependent 2,4-dienoyl-CoA reductase/sulfur reductase-like enzyme